MEDRSFVDLIKSEMIASENVDRYIEELKKMLKTYFISNPTKYISLYGGDCLHCPNQESQTMMIPSQFFYFTIDWLKEQGFTTSVDKYRGNLCDIYVHLM
jgi:hypothetical protein